MKPARKFVVTSPWRFSRLVYFHFLYSGTSRWSIRAGLHQCPCPTLEFFFHFSGQTGNGRASLQRPACYNVTDISAELLVLRWICCYGVRNQRRSYVLLIKTSTHKQRDLSIYSLHILYKDTKHGQTSYLLLALGSSGSFLLQTSTFI